MPQRRHNKGPSSPPSARPTAPADIAPVTGSTAIPRLKRCRCSKQDEEAELRRMLALYTTAVNNARSLGYQAGDDPGYSDPGVGLFNPSGTHKPGNCADWAQVSWGALVPWTWRCWHVQKIRARQHWTLFGYHHFVRLQSCSGRVVFLDPWKSGKPDRWDAKDFPFPDPAGWAHTPIRTHAAGAPPEDPGAD